MNFLSHFYADQESDNAYFILGCLLPDLLKNADKTWRINAAKIAAFPIHQQESISIINGWKRHLDIDAQFHNSLFFKTQTNLLFSLLKPIVIDSPIRASFLAHIALELSIDHQLIIQNKVSVSRFYEHLESIDTEILAQFLNACGIQDTAKYLSYQASFLKQKYLYEYKNIQNIAYSLQQICKRVWPIATNEVFVSNVEQQLICYQKTLKIEWKQAFEGLRN